MTVTRRGLAIAILGLTCVVVAPPSAAQEPAAAVAVEPRRLTRDEKKLAKDVIKAAFRATSDAAVQAELAKIYDLPPLTSADAKWAHRLVRQYMRFGTRVADKTKGVIRLADFPGMEGHYFLSGSKKKKRTPLLLGLHGGGKGVGDGKQIAGLFGGGPCLSVFPTVMQKDATAWNKEREERYVLELIEELKRTFDIDTNRIYLAGHSMGGFGTWSIGPHHADRFAALNPAAGGLFVTGGAGGVSSAGLLPNLYNTPVYCYHGTDDPRVKDTADRRGFEVMKKLKAQYPEGYDFTFKFYDGIGHGTPKDGYGPIWKWMLAKRRDPRPKTLVWEPTLATKRQFAWLYWPVPRKNRFRPPRIEARLTAKNRFELKRPVNGLAILLRHRFVDLKKPIVLLVDGKEVFNGLVYPSLRAMLESGTATRDPETLFTARLPVRRAGKNGD